MFLILRAAVLRGAMGRAAKLQDIWGKHDPKEPHWHLGPVGISPPLQGRGIGTQLMNRFCALVDEDRRPAYLETDRPENVPFYKRFGFRVVGEIPILAVDNWFMWRDAR
jgi:ribosomal protein S18 acetylase RimI-like enzyme